LFSKLQQNSLATKLHVFRHTIETGGQSKQIMNNKFCKKVKKQNKTQQQFKLNYFPRLKQSSGNEMFAAKVISFLFFCLTKVNSFQRIIIRLITNERQT
jgi:hypothetical protein